MYCKQKSLKILNYLTHVYLLLKSALLFGENYNNKIR